MRPILAKGRLITWKEHRGFGFIQPSNGGKDVFLPISVLPDDSRPPKVGDIILYQRVITPKGKVRASKAAIQGVISKSHITRQQKRPQPQGRLERATGIIVLATVGLITVMARCSQSPGPVATVLSPVNSVFRPGCNIKGNISVSTGKKLYHLPEMEDYAITNIRPEYGERWFCSEADAIENGWRKAPR